MNNIGYAVFGTPKGLKVDSNGLFKNLNLDKSLYFNNDHLALEKGDLLLMIRRVPSNLNNLLKEDALLIALYENALQHGENRAGGFVGSAICFKAHMPNAEEIVSGLMFLFSKIKENVDADNRFKFADSSDWNINLPDANKKFGLESGRLNYAPMSSNTTNVVVKLNSLKNEAASILYNFALNGAFHSTEYVYAATSKSVVDRIKSKNFIQVPISEFFNYSKHAAVIKSILEKESDKLKAVQLQTVNIDKKNASYHTELKKTENQVTQGKKQLDSLTRQLNEVQNKLAESQKNLRTASTVAHPTNRKGPNQQLKDSNELNSLKQTIDDVAINIHKHTNYTSHHNNNQDVVEDYFRGFGDRRGSENKKRVITNALLALLTFLLLIFIALFTWKTFTFNKYENKVQTEKTNSIQKVNEQKELDRKANERIQKLKNVGKHSVSANQNHKQFKELASELLIDHLENRTKIQEVNYINERAWEFYEFDYEKEKLVSKLNPKSKDTYLVTLNDRKIKTPLSKIKWLGNDDEQIKQLLNNYLTDTDNNDIYQDLNLTIINDTQLMLKHFKWMIEKENGDIEDLEIGQQINLPFTEKNKIQ